MKAFKNLFIFLPNYHTKLSHFLDFFSLKEMKNLFTVPKKKVGYIRNDAMRTYAPFELFD